MKMTYASSQSALSKLLTTPCVLNRCRSESILPFAGVLFFCAYVTQDVDYIGLCCLRVECCLASGSDVNQMSELQLVSCLFILSFVRWFVRLDEAGLCSCCVLVAVMCFVILSAVVPSPHFCRSPSHTDHLPSNSQEGWAIRCCVVNEQYQSVDPSFLARCAAGLFSQ